MPGGVRMYMEKAAGICGIDHIGYAVADMDAAKKTFSALGYKKFETKR